MKHIAFYISAIALAGIICVHAQTVSRTAALYDPARKYTVEELHFDLAILKDALIKVHPGLFWYQSEEAFEVNYNRLVASVNSPMNDLDFYIHITPFISSIKCGHTDLVMPEQFYKDIQQIQSAFPLEVYIINSKIYITENYSGDTTIPLGTEILSINGISSDSLLVLMKPHGWSDGYTSSYTRIQIGLFLQPFFFRYFNFCKNYILEIKEPTGRVRTISLAALHYQTIQERSQVKHNKVDSPYKFRIVDSLNTAIITLKTFMGNGYYTFLEKSFKTIRERNIGSLLIDLRGNDGGDGYYGRALYNYIALGEYKYYDHLEMIIKDPSDTIFNYGKMPFSGLRLKYFHAFRLKKNQSDRYDLKNGVNKDLTNRPFKPGKDSFKGRVFVLTDVRCASTTTEFCAVTKYRQRAKFVGRETGGAYAGNTSGWHFLLTLPKTKIMVYIPLIKYYMAVKAPHGSGIVPDYHLNEDIQDIILNRDSDLLFVLNLISQQE